MRKYTAEVRRIDEMERRLEVINRELVKDEIEISEMDEEPHHPSTREIIDLEALIEKTETEVNELSENYAKLIENQREFLEYRCVLERAEYFFAGGTPNLSSDEEDDGENHQLHFVAGIIDVERFYGFERMLWRVTHGNVFIKQATVDEPFKDPKSVSQSNISVKHSIQFNFPSGKRSIQGGIRCFFPRRSNQVEGEENL